MKYLLFTVLGLFLKSCNTTVQNDEYKTENLVIQKLTDHVYQHISFLQTDDYGKVACNGIIVLNCPEVVVFDTPVGKAANEELIDWVQTNIDAEISMVIPTHFHRDCLDGLETFHHNGIKSVAHLRTINFAKDHQLPLPQYGFENSLEIKNEESGKMIEVTFFGEGHTRDNVVAYVPGEEVLFGGCLIKSNGAGKGNLEDANIKVWPETVDKIKEKYPTLKTVVPGHGKPGGLEMLDYTLQLFKN